MEILQGEQDGDLADNNGILPGSTQAPAGSYSLEKSPGETPRTALRW